MKIWKSPRLGQDALRAFREWGKQGGKARQKLTKAKRSAIAAKGWVTRRKTASDANGR